MQEKETKYALITGGSMGIGKAIAIELAQKSTPLLLVALEEPMLYQTADELRQTYQIPVETLGINLVDEQSPQRVFDWCQENNYAVNILINNAGFGRGGQMHAFQLSEYYAMMALNNRATVGLTYLFIPELERHDEAYILIMSSMEAMLPLPYKAVYAGTKNFLFGYALALREELSGKNIGVTVMCPGPTVTNESGLKRIQANPSNKILVKMPDEVARAGVNGMFQRKNIVVPGRLQSTFFSLGKHLPTRLKMRLLKRISQSFANDPG
ncbi:SDR family NAD(P)-dependent oxidoreductase [Flavilitoribacter nigricans]|uniref:Short-chain dehydrogenase n=1 Tax=Flavilitoribacter nigricans (strain ATCC 23147 / DSM 23189 / NBRC 102662 / NCIMB 1420 / SS-2) TaxID=1122177 RepID=A0A2D0MYQ7_FLAN2|nr:SDR family NAD(P)-dependent oxidoreductase [Flavilitoribacter nigricans]PHN01411.1 short-chain dehydrogenase [Flavilitoribacter nigricans DSM 23189 = NBRC 102662]